MLSDHDIMRSITSSQLEIEPFDLLRLQPASYDLTLDSLFRTPVDGVDFIDLAAVPDAHTELRTMVDGYYDLASGEFLLASTVEFVRLGATLAARVEGRSSLGRLGLMVHITAGFIDPGFSGNVTFEIFNASPWTLRLYAGMKVAQLAFMRISSSPSRTYDSIGNYQGQRGPTESRFKLRS